MVRIGFYLIDFECIYMVDVDENVYVGDIFW